MDFCRIRKYLRDKILIKSKKRNFWNFPFTLRNNFNARFRLFNLNANFSQSEKINSHII